MGMRFRACGPAAGSSAGMTSSQLSPVAGSAARLIAVSDAYRVRRPRRTAQTAPRAGSQSDRPASRRPGLRYGTRGPQHRHPRARCQRLGGVLGLLPHASLGRSDLLCGPLSRVEAAFCHSESSSRTLSVILEMVSLETFAP